MMPDDERRHVDVLLFEYRRRLRFRQQQRVRLGDTADPAIEADIEDTRRQIAALEPLTEPSLAPEVREVIKRRADDDLFIYTVVTGWGERLTKLEGIVGILRADVGSVQAAQQQGKTERIAGQRRNFWLQLAVLCLLIVMLGILLWVFR